MSIDARDVLELLQGQAGGTPPAPDNTGTPDDGPDVNDITETLKKQVISSAVNNVVTPQEGGQNEMLTLVTMMKEQQEANKLLMDEITKLKSQKTEDVKPTADDNQVVNEEKKDKTLDKDGVDATIKVDTSNTELENNLKQMKKEMLRVEYGLDSKTFSTIETVAKNLNVDLLTKPDYIPMIITEIEKATNKPVGKTFNIVDAPNTRDANGLEGQVNQHIESSQALLAQYNITL